MNAKRLTPVLALLSLAAFCRAGQAPKERATLPNLPGDVRSVVFSPDGKWIAVCTGVKIVLWEWESSKAPAEPMDGGVGASFSNDGSLLAFQGQDETFNDGLMIWDLAAKKKKLFIQDDNIQSPIFSPDGKKISAAVGSIVKTWELATGAELPAMKDGHKCSINAIRYVADGKMLVSADSKGTICGWDTADATKKTEYKRDNNEAPIQALAGTRTGKIIAASTGDGKILILDATTLTLAGMMDGHKDGLRVKSVAFAADDKLLASACSGLEDLDLKLWDAVARKLLVSFTPHAGACNCVAFSPDSKWIATGSDDKSVKVWEVASIFAANAPKPEKKKEPEKN